MIYQHEVTLPSGGSNTNQTKYLFQLPGGKLSHIKIAFTIESAGAAHCALYEREWKLLPATADTFFSWAGYVFEFDIDIELPKGYSDFSIRGWNDSVTQPHTIFWWFTVIPHNKLLDNLFSTLQVPLPVSNIDL